MYRELLIPLLLGIVVSGKEYLQKPRRHPDCLQPKKIGPCEALVPRWFFNVKSSRCEFFQWGGCKPNKNNFKTSQSCNAKCPPRERCLDPLKVGPCRAAINRWYYNANTEKCELFSWGGCQPNGNNFMTLSKCKASCEPINQPGDECLEPRKVGPCRAAFPRWYYNTTTKKCERFTWGGCKPNGNNFKTLKACAKTCKTSQTRPKLCNLPSASGPCLAYFPKYFYNSVTNKCERFIYGGCQGNKNRFNTIGQCFKTCGGKVCKPRPSPRFCFLPKDVGPCDGYFPRYFYNKKTKSCKRFGFGGCGGNRNNFKTLRRCQSVCGYKKCH